MNTCATCKHWEADKLPVGIVLFGECPLITDGRERDAASIRGYDIDCFQTRSDFGCTLWQARDGVLGNVMCDGRSSWPKESE